MVTFPCGTNRILRLPLRTRREDNMKRSIIQLSFLVALLTVQSAMAAPEVVNFANVTGATVKFVSTGTGASFTFPPNSVTSNDFQVTSIANFANPDAGGSML